MYTYTHFAEQGAIFSHSLYWRLFSVWG